MNLPHEYHYTDPESRQTRSLEFRNGLDPHPTLNWKALFRVPGFPFFFFAMLVSLFGTGMNFAGVTWYVLGATHSTVKVSLIVILVTLPGLVVPPFGGVLIDRVDRRYLGITLDAARAVIVLGTAALAYAGRLALWELYSMVLLLGVGFAIYWSTTNALVQELVPREKLVTANATVLIAVQGGMTAAGALVGFIYERSGLAGILGIDGTTYLISAICLLLLRRGYHAPQDALQHAPCCPHPRPLKRLRKCPSHRCCVPTRRRLPRRVFSQTSPKGWGTCGSNRACWRSGITYACMMAGVISANVLVVALAKDLAVRGRSRIRIHRGRLGDRGDGGGLAAGTVARKRPYSVLILALATLAVGHTLFPYARLPGHGGGDECAIRRVPRAGRRADAILDHGGRAETAHGPDAIGIFSDRERFCK